jgi:hypothetical protein
MTTTTSTPTEPYAVFQPNGGLPLPEKPKRHRDRSPMLEAKLEDLFRRSVRGLLRGRTLKIVPTEKGAPDRLVLLPGGKMYLVELKTETGRLSPAQRLWHDRAGQLGIRVHVLYGEDELLRWVADRQAELYQ